MKFEPKGGWAGLSSCKMFMPPNCWKSPTIIRR